MNQRQFSQLINKKNIIKFLEENPDNLVHQNSFNMCPIAEYLKAKANAEYIHVTKQEISYRHNRRIMFEYYNPTKWAIKFIDFVDNCRVGRGTYPYQPIYFRDIIQAVKEIK